VSGEHDTFQHTAFTGSVARTILSWKWRVIRSYLQAERLQPVAKHFANSCF
jgi:hypothetical protein